MARQHGGEIYDFENMTDDEIRQVVVEHLREYPGVDAGWVDVAVKDGFVTLSGRVGTDGEFQVVESLVDDMLGIDSYSNELVVSELHRGEAPEGADEAAVQNEEVESQLGGKETHQSDTAAHMEQDLDSQTYGTHDMGQAIREGTPYSPPDRPVPDGYDSREDH